MANHRAMLKEIMEKALPTTLNDMVILYVSITGSKDGRYIEANHTQRFYSKAIENVHCSAIQLTTTTSLCSVIDLVLNNPGQYQGWVKQEDFKLEDIINNRFGVYFKSKH